MLSSCIEVISKRENPVTNRNASATRATQTATHDGLQPATQAATFAWFAATLDGSLCQSLGGTAAVCRIPPLPTGILSRHRQFIFLRGGEGEISTRDRRHKGFGLLTEDLGGLYRGRERTLAL